MWWVILKKLVLSCLFCVAAWPFYFSYKVQICSMAPGCYSHGSHGPPFHLNAAPNKKKTLSTFCHVPLRNRRLGSGPNTQQIQGLLKLLQSKSKPTPDSSFSVEAGWVEHVLHRGFIFPRMGITSPLRSLFVKAQFGRPGASPLSAPAQPSTRPLKAQLEPDGLGNRSECFKLLQNVPFPSLCGHSWQLPSFQASSHPKC